MKTSTYYLLIVLLFISLGASSQSLNWAFNVGGTSASTDDRTETGVFVFNDPSGKIVNVGNFTGTADMDPSAGTFNLTSGSSNQQSAYIAWYDNNKNILWAGKIDNLDASVLTAGEIDSSGNVYIGGYISADVNFDMKGGSKILSYNSNSSAFLDNYFIAKYDPNGNLVWVYSFTGMSGFTLDNSNNLYVTGVVEPGYTDIDPKPATQYPLVPQNESAVYIAKYDVNLNVLFGGKIEIAASNAGTAYAYGISVKNNNLFITGTYTGQVDFDPSAATYNLPIIPTGQPHEDVFYAKYDATTGNFSWANSIVCNGEHAFMHSLADASGFYLVGMTNSTTIDFDPSPATASYVGSGGSDTYLAKYDNVTGALLWADYTLNMSPFSIALGTQNIYLHTIADVGNDLDPSSAVYSMPSQNNTIVAYDLNSGALKWASAIGGSNQVTLGFSLAYMAGKSITVDAQENVYATGAFFPVPFQSPVCDLDPTPNTYILTLLGRNTDIYLVKYSPMQLNFTSNKTVYCQGETMTVNYNAVGYYPAGNQFTFLLSDASGSFASATVLASLATSAITGNFNHLILSNFPPGTGYKIRMTASNPSTVPLFEKAITINATPATPVISGASSVCGNALGKIYSVAANTGSTYAWTPPTNGNISVPSTTAQVTIDFNGYVATGNLNVVETNSFSCVSPMASFSIAPLAVPVTSAITGVTSVCGNATGQSFSVTNTTGSSYVWTKPNNSTINGAQNLNTVTLDFAGFIASGTLKVSETNSVGCTSAPVSLSLSPLPVPSTSSIIGLTSVCGNATGVSYSVTTTSGSSYVWGATTGGTVFSGQGTHAAVFNFSGFPTGSIFVAETNSSGCTGSTVSLPVTGLAIPVTSAISGPDSICGNAIDISYSVTIHSGSAYLWTGTPAMGITIGANPNAVALYCNNYTTGANLIVTETNTATGCSGLPVSLFLRPLTAPTAKTISGTTSLCSVAKGMVYSVPAATGSTFIWVPVAGSTVNGSNGGNSITIDFNNFTANSSLKVTEVAANGCQGPINSLALTAKLSPSPNTITGSNVNCYFGNNVNYSCTSHAPVMTLQWTPPANAVAVSSTTGNNFLMKFTDDYGGDLMVTETYTGTGCSVQTVYNIASPPHPVITGPAVVCAQSNFTYTYSVPVESATATYGWRTSSPAVQVSGNTSNQITLTFPGLKTPTDLMILREDIRGCQRTADFTVGPRTSPNMPTIQGPGFSCIQANNSNVAYQLDHANAGYMYTWSTSTNFQIQSNPTLTSVTVDLRRLVSLSSIGILTANEMDMSDGCVVAQITKQIVGWATSQGVDGRMNICDDSKTYAYSVRSPETGSTFNWSTNNGSILTGNGTSNITVKYSSPLPTSNLIMTETSILGCQNTLNFSILYDANKYSVPSQQISCAHNSFIMNFSKDIYDANVNKVELIFTYNNSYASLNTTTPYTVSNIIGSDNQPATVSVTETTPGTIKISLTASSGKYLSFLTNFISLNFDINHNNMNVGDVNTFSSTSINEYLLDGSIENCNTFTAAVTKILPSTIHQGNLIYNNNPYIQLGYNAAIPTQYLITNISGSSASDCSVLGSPTNPDLYGNFSYDITNGNYININRDILVADVSTFINGADASKVNTIVNGFDPMNMNITRVDIYGLLSADVNRDGKITSDDYTQVLNRSTKLITQYTDANGNPTPDWNFIPQYTVNNSPAYANIYGNYFQFTGGLLKYDSSKTIPLVPSCILVRQVSNGLCSEAPAETYQGILNGDVDIPYQYSMNSGRFDNRAYSNMRVASTGTDKANVVCDLSQSVMLTSTKFKFPVYIYAADTGYAIDLHLDYDQTKMTIDTVEKSTDEINDKFIYAYNDDNNDILRISGFGPQVILSNVNVLYVTASLVNSSISKDLLGTFEKTLINGVPADGVIIDKLATDITDSSIPATAIYLYPNPASDLLNIEGLENLTTPATVTLISSLGIEIPSKFSNGQINIENLASGIYFVKIVANGNTKMLRFTKL